MRTETTSIPLLDGTADPLRGDVVRGAVRHRLTEIERRLIRYFADHPHEPITRERLLVDVWEYAPTVRSRAADHTIARLRNKVEVDPAEPRLLQTVHGVGYRWVPPGPGSSPRAVRPAVTLVGREAALEALRAAVVGHRVVAVVGPPGVGKSALAGALGFPRIDLSDAVDLDDALLALARTLQVPVSPTLDPASLAVAAAARSPLWLDGVDGFDASPLLTAWPGARLLLTCRRAPRGVDHSVRVGPLALDAAAALLAARAGAAGAAHPDWQDPVSLRAAAERVDGLPLALELIGALASWLSPAQVLARLDEAPGAVWGGEGGLLASVRAALAGLDGPQRDVLAQVASFRRAPLAALDATGTAAALPGVVERGLIWVDAGPSDVRYRVLRPVADVLRAEDPRRIAAAEQRHADWVAAEALARSAHPGHDVHDPTWWRAHLDELHLAAVRHRDPAVRARLALCVAWLAGFGWTPHPQRWVASALADARAAGDRSLQCAALLRRALLEGHGARTDVSLDPPEGDLGEAAALAVSGMDRAMVVHHLAKHAIDLGRYEEALALDERALAAFDAEGSSQGEIDVRLCRIDALYALQRPAEALADASEVIRLALDVDDPRGLGMAYSIRAFGAPEMGDALEDMQRSLDVFEGIHDWNAAIRVRLARARNLAMAGMPTEPIAPLVQWADELGPDRLRARSRMEAAAAALHEGDLEGMRRWGVDSLSACRRDRFEPLWYGLRLMEGETRVAVEGLDAELDDPARANPTGGLLFAVGCLELDEPSRWLPAIARFEDLLDRVGPCGPYTRFRATYRELARALRAGVSALGDGEAARAWLATPRPPGLLPVYLREEAAWRALASGDPVALPAVGGPELRALAALVARREGG